MTHYLKQPTVITEVTEWCKFLLETSLQDIKKFKVLNFLYNFYSQLNHWVLLAITFNNEATLQNYIYLPIWHLSMVYSNNNSLLKEMSFCILEMIFVGLPIHLKLWADSFQFSQTRDQFNSAAFTCSFVTYNCTKLHVHVKIGYAHYALKST